MRKRDYFVRLAEVPERDAPVAVGAGIVGIGRQKPGIDFQFLLRAWHLALD